MNPERSFDEHALRHCESVPCSNNPTQSAKPAEEAQGMTLGDVVLEFFDLRERGPSLSPQDLQILAKWEKAQTDPILLVQKMRSFKSICDRTGENFPSSLAQLEKKLKKWTLDETTLP